MCRGIDPLDESDLAKSRRQLERLEDLNSLRFCALIGQRQDPTGQYAPKNNLKRILRKTDAGYFLFQAQ